jgi:hypothetical protein
VNIIIYKKIIDRKGVRIKDKKEKGNISINKQRRNK